MGLSILVVDDELLSRETTAHQLNAAGYKAESHESAQSALQALEKEDRDAVLTDLRMPGMDGMQFLREIKQRRPATAVILMTAHATVQTAIEAMRLGALDYLTKPFQFDELAIRLERLAEMKHMREENASLRQALGAAPARSGLVGHSSAMRRVYDLIDQFAGLPSNILIVGETGTGKEVVARAIHARSAFARGPFVAVGCAAVPRELAESELFGHEAGAFTGAVKRRKGKVELAEGGTLFLDDVDDMPLELQGKLLRVIQERQFERVGGEKPVSANLRLIAATKVALEDLVKQGKFRDDLMYRLCVLAIPLPSLRERTEDILPLAAHFIETLARERGAPAKPLSNDAAARLQHFAWPGNVRELRHALEYALAVAREASIGLGDLPPKLLPVQKTRRLGLDLDGYDQVDLRAMVEEFEREVVRWAMTRADGNQGKAAQILGIPRSTLQFKLTERKPPTET